MLSFGQFSRIRCAILFIFSFEYMKKCKIQAVEIQNYFLCLKLLLLSMLLNCYRAYTQGFIKLLQITNHISKEIHPTTKQPIPYESCIFVDMPYTYIYAHNKNMHIPIYWPLHKNTYHVYRIVWNVHNNLDELHPACKLLPYQKRKRKISTITSLSVRKNHLSFIHAS